MYDKFRQVGADANDWQNSKYVLADNAAAETAVNGWQMNFNSNGFTIPDWGRDGLNKIGETYIWMAWA